MDEERKVGFPEALEMLETLLTKQLERRGRVPSAVVTLGGTALAAHSIRAQSDNVDVYLSEVDDEAVAHTEAVGRRRFGERFKIDATPVNTVWGEIAISDIEASPSFTTLHVGPYAIQIRALSVETLYIVKVAADRPKDRDDVPAIGRSTGYGAVLERARQLLPSYSDRKAFPGRGCFRPNPAVAVTAKPSRKQSSIVRAAGALRPCAPVMRSSPAGQYPR